MSHFIGVTHTARNKIKYNKIPTVRGSMWRYSVDRYDRETYDNMLDSIYEMTYDVASANGIEIDKAISQVLKDEDWYILPSHKKIIQTMLEE